MSGRKRPLSSLRQRISLAVVGITSLVVAVAAVTAWMSSAALVTTSHDQSLASWTKRVREEGPTMVGRFLMFQSHSSGRWRNGPFSDQRLLFQLVDAHGHELGRSASLGDGQTLVDLAPPEGVAPTTARLGDGRTIRVAVFTIASVKFEPPRSDANRPRPTPTSSPENTGVPAPPPGPPPEFANLDVPLTFALAIDATRLREELVRSAWTMGGMWLAATVLAWGAVLLLRRAILRPLERLGDLLEGLGPDDLAARLPADAGPDEARVVVARLNSLLDRLHQAFQREQATIANIAHELRTPVAAVRTDLEFRLMVATDPAERMVLTSCMGTIAAMQDQIARLLLLARLEAGTETLPTVTVDIVKLVRERVCRFESAAACRQQRLLTEVPDDLVVTTAPQHLEQLIDNLLLNAVAHGIEGYPITVTVEDVSQVTRITVANPFVGTLDDASLGKAYYRGDQARHDRGHCGLGLALGHRLSRVLQGSLQVQALEGVFRAVIELPPVASNETPSEEA